MSEEDKFFGVKTTIESPEATPKASQAEVIDEIEVEVVDDRPKEDQRDIIDVQTTDSDVEIDKEIAGYNQKAQKRLKRLKFDYHNERRAKEEAEKLSNEAVNYSQNLQIENQRLLKLVENSQTALTQHSKYGADSALAIAQENFKQAHESGDSGEIMAAQQALTNAQLAQASAPAISQRVIDNWKKQVLTEQRQQGQRQDYVEPAVPEPDPLAVEWEKDNPWFGVDKEMTSFAYGVHERLIKDEGIDPNTEEYYELIDRRMGEVFPAQIGDSGASVSVDTATRRKASPVVAPASRNNGVTPRKVTLTQTQVSLSKRLGITPQQYAAQLIKEMS